MATSLSHTDLEELRKRIDEEIASRIYEPQINRGPYGPGFVWVILSPDDEVGILIENLEPFEQFGTFYYDLIWESYNEETGERLVEFTDIRDAENAVKNLQGRYNISLSKEEEEE